jgi:5-methylthioadenosine/S-adenosylhomocysteine deaminase
MKTDLLLESCDVLQVIDGKVVLQKEQAIGISGNRIEFVSPVETLDGHEVTERLDAKGMLAIPGLINTHAHVPMVLFRNLGEDLPIERWFNEVIWPLESNLEAEDVYWGMLLGLVEMIEAGITFVADHYFYMDEVARAVEKAGIRANLAWAVFGHEGEEKLDQTCAFVERWQGGAGGRITAWLGPHAPYTCDIRFLKLAASRARELSIGIHIHVSETAEQVRMSLSQHGKTPVEVLQEAGILDVPALLAHCIHATPEDLLILKGRQVGIAHAPKTYLKLAMGMPVLKSFLDAGIPVGLATDGAVSSNTLDILEALRLMGMLQKHITQDASVMPIPQALDLMFNGGAAVVGMQNDLGAIAPGKLADITLLRQEDAHVWPQYDPAASLVYAHRSSDVDTVICDGKVLMKNRQLLTIDKQQVLDEVAQRIERLNRRIPGRQIAEYRTEE